MKKRFRLFCTLAPMVMNAQAMAADGATIPDTNADDESGFYVSAGLGRVEPDLTDATFRINGQVVPGNTLRQEFDRAPMLRVSGGYSWRQWALELSYEHTLKAGEFSVGNLNGDFDYGNLSVAGVYRGSGRFYPVIKLGFSQPDMDTDAQNGRLNLDSAGFAGGGFGYRLDASLSLEFDFTRSSDDTSAFMLNLRRRF